MQKIHLRDIDSIIHEYAYLLADILKLNVEIVDSNFYRIAGTGIFKNKIGENIEGKGYVFSEAIKTGKSQIVYEPGKDDICRYCEERNSCKEYMEICVPIKYGNETMGVIGLICSTDQQRKHLQKNLTNILSFLEKIADFISIKVIETADVLENRNNLDFLEQIINSIDEGVITIGKDGIINSINNKGLKILELTPDVINKKVIIEDTGEYLPGGEVFYINIEDKNKKVVGKVIYNHINFENCDRIILFKEFIEINKQVINLAHGNNNIGISDIIGESRTIVQLKSKIKRIAGSKSTVFITGESGTGKELVARAIHFEGDRKDKPFIAINCGAIPESLLESELFGYVKGAFSGASSNGRIGKFELANNGIIFLDEIGDMPLHLQVKLLRVLQERSIIKIGSNKLIELDLRVVAATNKDLKKLVDEGKFREDLYYRLNVIPIEMPPLRDRGDDILLITRELIKKYNMLFDKYIHTIDEDVEKILREYSWKGNIRELENAIEFMVNVADESGVIRKDMLPKAILRNDKSEIIKEKNGESVKTLKEIEIEHIEKVLDSCGRDTDGKKKAAKILGIGIATLYRKIGETL